MRVIYRAGRPSRGNLTPRPKDNNRLSCRATLSNPWPRTEGVRPIFEPGEPYLVIDSDLLPIESVIDDDNPSGHVSVVGMDWEIILRAVIDRGKTPS